MLVVVVVVINVEVTVLPGSVLVRVDVEVTVLPAKVTVVVVVDVVEVTEEMVSEMTEIELEPWLLTKTSPLAES